MTAVADAAATIVELPLDVVVPGDNDRTLFDDLGLLAASIREHGVLQPVTVRPVGDLYELVAGERRYRATRLAGLATIPAIVRWMDDDQAADAMLFENTHRADLSPMDEARAYRKRLDRGSTVERVAEVAGRGVQQVRMRLDLLELVEPVQAMVANGNLDAGWAWWMHSLDSNRQHLALAALNKGATFADYRDLCTKLRAEQEAQSMFDPDSFLQVEDLVLQVRRERKPSPKVLAKMLAKALDDAGIRPELVELAREVVGE